MKIRPEMAHHVVASREVNALWRRPRARKHRQGCSDNEVLGNHRGHLSKAGWSWGCVAAVDSNGRTVWIADTHRGDGKRFVVDADDKLTAFMELESALRAPSAKLSFLQNRS
jgi:hypothetical protein